ncbi:MAG: DUF6541 family protein [Corynebacterium sp.]|nr:DUF6541 family protein [Corynebacterium sp.]
MAEPTLIALAVCMLPGFLIGWISGLRAPAAIVGSIPLSFGMYGILAMAFYPLGIGYRVSTVAVGIGVAAVVAAVWRLVFYLVRRRRAQPYSFVPQPQLVGRAPAVPATAIARRASTYVHMNPGWRPGTLLSYEWILPALGAAAGAYFLIVRTVQRIGEAPFGGMASIPQGWDSHWHASVIQFIGDSGIASASQMGQLMNTETQHPFFYPLAFHDAAYLVKVLTGLSTFETLNLVSAVFPGAALPISMAALAWKVLGNRGMTAQIAAGLAPILGGLSPVIYWIIYYVGAWPYLTATAMVGAVVMLFMQVPAAPVRMFAAALGLAGLVQTHPSPVTHVVLLLACWWLFYLVWRPSRVPRSLVQGIVLRLHDVALLAVTGIAGGVVILPQLMRGSDAVSDVASFGDTLPKASAAQAWSTAFHMTTRHVDDMGLNSQYLLPVAVIGMVIVTVWSRNLWALAFYLLMVAVTARTMFDVGGPAAPLLQAIGGLHYSGAHRLIAVVGMMVVVYAACAIAVIIRVVTGGTVRQLSVFSLVASFVLALAVGAVSWWRVDATTAPHTYFPISESRDGRLSNDHDIASWEWLAEQPHAYEGRIFFDLANGSGHMYAYNGLPAFFKHYNWPWAMSDSDSTLLFFHPNALGVGNWGQPQYRNTVDEAARRQHVNFIVVSPPNFWDWQPTLPEMTPGLFDTPGVTTVYRDGDIAIFAVNEAFTDAELTQMRQSGGSPDPLPPVELDENGEPIYHRPESVLLTTAPEDSSEGDNRPPNQPVPGDFDGDGIFDGSQEQGKAQPPA